MTLQEQIQEFQSNLLESIPKETLQTIQNSTVEMINSGIEERTIKKGSRIPVFSLPNSSGKLVNSIELLRDGPLIISFYRGAWCPYCNLELRALQEQLPKIQKLGAQLVAISPNLPDTSLSFKEKNELTFEVLSDIGNSLAKDFGLVYNLGCELRDLYSQFGFDIPAQNGDDSYSLPIPATYIVRQDGVIDYAYVKADYTERMEPSLILEKLKNLIQASCSI